MNTYNYFNITGILTYIHIGSTVLKNLRNLLKGYTGIYIYIYPCIVVLFILIHVVNIPFTIKFKNYAFL